MTKKLFFILSILFLANNILAKDYLLKILGENQLKEILVDDEKLVLAETDFKWTDSEANFGKGYCLGSISSISNLNTLSFLCEFIDYEGEKFWTKIYRSSRELSSGVGYQKFIKVTEKYSKLLDIECKYGVSWFDKTSFLMQQNCNL